MQNNTVVLVGGVQLSSFKYNHRDSDLPLGLLSIASVLDERGYDVEIVDFNLLIKRDEITVRPDFHEAAAAHVLEMDPDFVGFYTAVGVHHHALQIADELKAGATDLPILMGGPHASFMDADTIAHFPQVDYILRGEAERTFVELLDTLQNDDPDIRHVDGVTYRRDGVTVRNDDRDLIEDLDELPIPRYDLYDLDEIEDERIPIEVGRGCPYHCSFCSTSFFWRRSYRLKSIDRITAEIRHLHEEFGVTKFFFMHDNLTANRELTIELCEEIAAMDIDVSWGCAARIDHMDDELLDTMDDSGCDLLEFGIESMSDRIQERINKNLDESTIRRLLSELERRDFFVVLYFIGGFPYETRADLFETLEFVVEANRSLAGSVYTRMTRLRAFSGTETIETEQDALVYGPEPLKSVNTAFYPEEYLQLARKTHTLFPELYYFENTEDLPLELLQKYTEFVNTFVVFTSTYLPKTFEQILVDFDSDWNFLANTWSQYYDEHIKNGGWNALPNNIRGYITDLYESNRAEPPEYLDDLITYELTSYEARNYVITAARQPDRERDGGPEFGPGVKVVETEYRISDIVGQSVTDERSMDVERESTTYVFKPESSEDVTIMRANEVQRSILDHVDAATSVREVRDNVTADISVEDPAAVDDAIDVLRKHEILR